MNLPEELSRRGAPGGDCRGQGEDRSAGQGRSRGRLRRQAAAREQRAKKKASARRSAAGAAEWHAQGHRSRQLHRRRLAHHAGARRWLRASLQRPGRRGYRQPVGGGDRADAGDQRRAAVVPMLEQLQALPKDLGRVKRLLADTGYASEDNVNACAQAKIQPLIALGREAHHGSPFDCFAEPAPLPCKPTPLVAMRHRLRRDAGASCTCCANAR